MVHSKFLDFITQYLIFVRESSEVISQKYLRSKCLLFLGSQCSMELSFAAMMAA